MKIYEPEIFSAFNEDPYRELQNANDKGQQNADILSKYAHFFTWKTSVYISIIAQKNTTISLKVEMNSLMMIIGLYAPLTPTTDSALRTVVGCTPQL